MDDGACMLVTEFMEGGDLHSALKKGTVTWYKRCAASPQLPQVHHIVAARACWSRRVQQGGDSHNAAEELGVTWYLVHSFSAASQ